MRAMENTGCRKHGNRKYGLQTAQLVYEWMFCVLVKVCHLSPTKHHSTSILHIGACALRGRARPSPGEGTWSCIQISKGAVSCWLTRRFGSCRSPHLLRQLLAIEGLHHPSAMEIEGWQFVIKLTTQGVPYMDAFLLLIWPLDQQSYGMERKSSTQPSRPWHESWIF